jgi:ABC-type lipoprotein release transport system permease subunit
VWAALSLSGFMTGIMKSYVRGAIENSVGHLQIHAPQFTEDYELKYYLPDVQKVEQAIEAQAGIKAYSTRTVANGMASSSKGARGVMIKGVSPEKEAAISTLEDKLTEGEFFLEMRGNGILIGAELADKLNLKLRSKLVLTFQDLNREITAAAFRVVGIFDTGNTPFDGGTVFVKREDLNRLILPQQAEGQASEPLAHEIAILLEDVQQVEAVDASLGTALPGLDVKTYREVSPDLELYESQIGNISMIYLVVILLALVFGIINTMLMAVLERVKELGMLMAIGMNKGKVFAMIVLEAIMLGLVSAPIGLLLGYLTIEYVGEYGIDLSIYSGALADYGIEKIIYFEIAPEVYWEMAIGVFVTSVLAAIYPALKAIRLKPVEALQHV